MGFSSLGLINFFMSAPTIIGGVLLRAMGIIGVVGAVLAAMTREDAFEAAGRQNKWTWVAIVGVSALVCLLRVPFVAWFGTVAIGLYFLDVRPQLNNIIRGNSGW